MRQQLKLCHSYDSCIVPKGDTAFGIRENEDKNFPLKKYLPDFPDGIHVKTLRSVTILEFQFTKDTVCGVEFNKDGPIFGQLWISFYFDDSVYFLLNTFGTLDFNHNCHAYNIDTHSIRNEILINIGTISRLPPCILLRKTITIDDFSFYLE